MTTKTETKKANKYEFFYALTPGIVFGACVFQSHDLRNCFELNLGFVRMIWIKNGPTA